MNEGRCPLCDAPLPFPSGAHHARTFLDILTSHFGDVCPAIRIRR